MSLSLGFPVSTFLAVGATLSALTGIVVTIRIFSDLRFSGKLHLDDCNCSAYTDPTASLHLVSQYSLTSIWISGGLVWTSKAPIFLLYVRLFGVREWVRLMSLLTLVAFGLVLIAANSYNTAKCVPPKSDFEITHVFLANCSHASSIAGVVVGTFGLVTDIIIFILPIPVIIKLHLPLAKRIGIAIVFMTGLVAIVSTSVALSYKIRSFTGTGKDILVAMILTIVESTVVISAGCVPALRAFWVGVIVESGLYSTISSLISHVARGPSQSSLAPAYDSHEHINKYATLRANRSAKGSFKSDKSSKLNRVENGDTTDIPLETLPVHR
ncbi:hypothetical protein BGZ60DRAFT_363090 [Tricladium varicosporioides]|nr:hypothetical protein BGZ60DRAFT_363090 [Hymenoscyphus varicosporioides]